jgi:hypothetical protein
VSAWEPIPAHWHRISGGFGAPDRWLHEGLLLQVGTDGDIVVEDEGERRPLDSLEAKYLEVEAQLPDGRWLPAGHADVIAYFSEEGS